MQCIYELQQRNPLLFWYGLLCFAGGVICAILTKTTNIQVNHINAFIKPMKFFFSVWLFCFTMGWLVFELQQPSVANSYSLMVVIVMSIELIIITWQAANGRLSHFNILSALYRSLFMLMGIAITVLTAWTLYIGYQFFTVQPATIPLGYLWGIRLGIICFVIFAFEGGMMGARLSHTIGAADGGEGLPIVNWSKHFGDLRIAHFFGMHALQLLPLIGYFIFKKTSGIIVVSAIYFVFVSVMLVRALKGLPLVKPTQATPSITTEKV
jgi:hypothetical protein